MMQVLTDAQWAKFEAAIAAANIRGARPRREDRRTIEAIIWRLDNGAKWRSIPAELGDWHHAYLRFRRWAVRGVWDQIMAHVVARGEPQLAFACIDGTIARAHQKASGARSAKPRR
jgi:transposase